MGVPHLLLLIPAHNEERRLEPTLRRFAAYARDHYPGRFDLLVIVNGSRDNTLSLVHKVAREYPAVRCLDIPERIGKGGALIEGLSRATACDLVGYVDADGAPGPESFFTLVDRCADVDCVVGSRRVPGAVIHQYQPSHRQFASKVFHFFVWLFFRMSIKDTQCGAKVMRLAAAQKVLPNLHIADMAFDVNLLYALKRAHCTMREAPVEWTDHLGSTVRYFRTSLVMFLSILRLRLVYSPFYRWLRPLRPLEGRIYAALRNPPPRRLSGDRAP
jgi:glycosyltransferase involved in cell wall biosynthesis